jgi:hypothetical protein
MTERHLSPGQRTLIDLGPLVVFFCANYIIWDYGWYCSVDGCDSSDSHMYLPSSSSAPYLLCPL